MPRSRCRLVPLVAVSLLVLLPLAAEEEKPPVWGSDSPMPEVWDWIQLTSGEWLKGELIAMYDDSLEFDSDELDDLTLDWEDVAQVLTAHVMQVGLEHRVVVVGRLFVNGDKVRVFGSEGEQELERSQLITIAAGAPKEINYWSANVMFGLNLRRGNSNVAETTIDARLARRTARSRININYLGNYNETEGQEVANNHRATLDWNRYVSDRLYVTPVFFEWYRDPFQNISHRETYGAGFGYELVSKPKIEWRIGGGPAYQQTQYGSVTSGSNPASTPALIGSTTYDQDFTSWMEFFFEYRGQWVNEEAGQYNHHMVVSFETDITKLIDFDVTGVWDHIQKPRPALDETTGEPVVPQQNDLRLTVGLSFEF